MDLVLCQIWSGWMPSSSRRGSSSSNEAEADTADVEIVPPKDPDDDGTDPISKAMKGMAEEEGWKGAVGTRRWLMLPTLGLTPPPDGKTTGGTVNCLLIFVEAIAVLLWGHQGKFFLFLPSQGKYIVLKLGGEWKGVLDYSSGFFANG